MPDNSPLDEPLLEPYEAAAAREPYGSPTGRRRPPVAWFEFIDPNGRGLAVLTAFLLGVSCSATPLLLLLLPSAAPWAVYFTLLVCFHMSEYLLTAAFRPDTLGFDNFLINHSALYQAMVAVAWTEYWLEWSLCSETSWCAGTKQWSPLNTLGVLVCFVGLGVRALGMATASTNFSHKIEDEKRAEHELVTHGIYRLLRHPAYFGFFWWSVGTQLLLANPLCLAAYAAASFYFFYDRIPHEEALLIEFFGDAYRQYRRRTIIGIPGLEFAIKLSGESVD